LRIKGTELGGHRIFAKKRIIGTSIVVDAKVSHATESGVDSYHPAGGECLKLHVL